LYAIVGGARFLAEDGNLKVAGCFAAVVLDQGFKQFVAYRAVTDNYQLGLGAHAKYRTSVLMVGWVLSDAEQALCQPCLLS